MIDNTDNLIKDLVKQSRTTGRLMPTSSVLALYCLVVVLLLFVVYLTAPAEASVNSLQLISAALGLLAAYYAALTAIASSVPGESRFHHPLATAAYLLLWLFFDEVLQRYFMPVEPESSGFNCVQHVLMLALLPSLVLLVLVFNRAPLRSGFSAFFALCSAGIVANVCMRLCCGADTVFHDLFFHIAPCAGLLAIVVMLSKRFFSWEKRLVKLKSQEKRAL